MSGLEVREKMATEERFDVKKNYIISQIAHITCKKDHHEILSQTQSKNISAGYEKLQSSALLFIEPPTSSSKIKASYVAKHALNICLEKDANDDTMRHLSYMISSGNKNEFSMKCIEEENFQIG